MLLRLVHERAQDGFMVGLDGAVEGRIQVRQLLLMQQRFEDGRTDGAGHTGERIDVDYTVEAFVSVFQRSADTERRFRPNIEVEQMTVVQPPFNGRDGVIGLNVQMPQSTPKSLVLTPGLIPFFDFLGQPLPNQTGERKQILPSPGLTHFSPEFPRLVVGDVIDIHPRKH